jgi:Outer membrane protein beta-barrel domain
MIIQFINPVKAISTAKKIAYSKKGRTTSSVSGEYTETEGVEGGTNKTFVQPGGKGKNTTTAIIDKKNPPTDNIAVIKETVNKTDTPSIAKNKHKAEKSKAKGLSKFYLLAVAGADNANVQLLSFSNSQISPKLGIGIGYQLNKRISIQTGFYFGHKKYVAGPADYTFKPNSYWSGVKILKVDGDCNVYEIPLALRYNIIFNKSITYYTVAGLSSYLMKKEEYDYHYIQSNTYYKKEWGYTGNKNFFSVLTIAAGVEKKLSEKFYLQVEPAIAIPIAGVGDGKVKLYSSSLLIGVRYLPFKKNK